MEGPFCLFSRKESLGNLLKNLHMGLKKPHTKHF